MALGLGLGTRGGGGGGGIPPAFWNTNWSSLGIYEANNVSEAAGVVTNWPNIINPGTFDLAPPGTAPAYSTTGWGGDQPIITFNGSTQCLQTTAFGGVLNGEDTPFACICAVDISGVSEYFITLGSSTGTVPYMGVIRWRASTFTVERRGDSGSAVLANSSTITMPTGRMIVLMTFAGTTVTVKYKTSSVSLTTVIDGGAMNSAACTFDRMTVGALGRDTVTQFSPGGIAMLGFGMSISNEAGLIEQVETRWPLAA